MYLVGKCGFGCVGIKRDVNCLCFIIGNICCKIRLIVSDLVLYRDKIIMVEV